MNPNSSIAETPEVAAQQVANVRRYFCGRPLVVSPVTLRPRFNPNSTGPEPVVPTGELPPQVDPRQISLLGAAWTRPRSRRSAESGEASAIFYEATGWRGMMETAAGSPLPEKFPSIPRAVFPLYHVLVDVGDFSGGEVLRTESSDPLAVASLLSRAGGRCRLIVANLCAEPRCARLQILMKSFYRARRMPRLASHP